MSEVTYYVLPNRKWLNFFKWIWLKLLGKNIIQGYTDGDIQKAIDSLPPEGGRILLLSGTYECPKMVRDNVHIIGHPRISAKIKYSK